MNTTNRLPLGPRRQLIEDGAEDARLLGQLAALVDACPDRHPAIAAPRDWAVWRVARVAAVDLNLHDGARIKRFVDLDAGDKCRRELERDPLIGAAGRTWSPGAVEVALFRRVSIPGPLGCGNEKRQQGSSKRQRSGIETASHIFWVDFRRALNLLERPAGGVV